MIYFCDPFLQLPAFSHSKGRTLTLLGFSCSWDGVVFVHLNYTHFKSSGFQPQWAAEINFSHLRKKNINYADGWDESFLVVHGCEIIFNLPWTAWIISGHPAMDVRSFSVAHGWHESLLVTHGCECCDPFWGKERKAETLLGQGKWSELEVAVMARIRSGLVIYEILESLIWVFLLFIKVLFSPFIFSTSQIQLIWRHTRRRVAPELVSWPQSVVILCRANLIFEVCVKLRQEKKLDL